MPPRQHRAAGRDPAGQQTRDRIVAGALALVTAEDGLRDFTMDAVARQSGVSRMTVYYQFGSRTDLLDALADALAARGQIVDNLRGAFAQPQPLTMLDGLVEAFVRLWEVEPVAMRRLRSLSSVDPTLAPEVQARDGLRKVAARRVVERLVTDGLVPQAASGDAVDALDVLLSFEAWDLLGGRDGHIDQIRPVLHRLVRRTLGLEPA